MLCFFIAQLIPKYGTLVLWLLENKNNFYLFLSESIPTVMWGK